MNIEELKAYINLSMEALHKACELLSVSNINTEYVKKTYGEDKESQLLNELVHGGSDGLVNYFLYEAEEQSKN